MPGIGLIQGEPSPRRSAWVTVLAALLTVGEPLALAPEVARLAPTLGDRGAAVFLLLAARVVVTGVGVAAGLALFACRPHGARLARLALVLLAAASLVSILTPILPTSRPPGTAAPTAILVLIYYVGWLVYLGRSRRVGALFD